MCEPVTIAGVTLTASQAMFASSLAMGVAQAGIQYIGQSQAASAQADYEAQKVRQQNELIIANAEAANKAYIEEAATENIRMGQAQEAAGQQVQEVIKERMQAQGTTVASSEAAGLSVDLLMRDFLREEARYRNTVERQLKGDLDQGERNKESFEAKARDRSASVRPYIASPVQTPSLLGAGLQILGSAFDSYQRFNIPDPQMGMASSGASSGASAFRAGKGGYIKK